MLACLMMNIYLLTRDVLRIVLPLLLDAHETLSDQNFVRPAGRCQVRFACERARFLGHLGSARASARARIETPLT